MSVKSNTVIKNKIMTFFEQKILKNIFLNERSSIRGTLINYNRLITIVGPKFIVFGKFSVCPIKLIFEKNYRAANFGPKVANDRLHLLNYSF